MKKVAGGCCVSCGFAASSLLVVRSLWQKRSIAKVKFFTFLKDHGDCQPTPPPTDKAHLLRT